MADDKKTIFTPVSPKVSFPELEEAILRYWKDNRIFEKSIESRPVDKPWTFLDGPPFVTGLPHYGSLLSSLPKDLFGRYWTMKGYRVERKWGWDGHGLPIENKVENKLEIKRKKDIEDVIGVKRFIEECKKYVEEISGEWEWYVDHIGRWVDFQHAYKTWNTDYMESVLWVFKQMYDGGHIYKGLKVTLYCPHCATPISNFEVAMDADNYKEITDAATTYKYQLKDEPDTYMLAWSTTPWNKIVTPALAVNPNFDYVKVKQGEEYYILAKATLKTLDRHSERSEESHTADPSISSQDDNEKILNEAGHSEPDSGSRNIPDIIGNDKNFGKEYEIVDEFKGTELVGKEFIPHYDYYLIKPGEKAFVIVGGDFVTAEEGTGVVTIAAYGEEDLVVMQRDNIHIEMHLDEEGTIKPDVPKFGGMYYLKANKAVNADLAERGLIYKDEDLPHNVPLCWRCGTRLYYAPIDAWYVNIQNLKQQMLETNEKVQWFPKHFKYGRFQKSLEHAPDWNISRNRYWGSPVPVWECDCSERFVPGSIKELEDASGGKIADLHKPDIDKVEVTCKKCAKKVKRVPEVLDSWIEAGSASFAERHFPFNSSQKLENFYPPDYIAEYTGQIRAWFYVLHVIGNALYNSPAFKNVSVTGVILGTDGRKMSKNFKNYPDPKEMLEKYGGDALRLYLMGSPVMNGEDILISEEQYRMQVRGMMLILWNVYNFFVTYANIDNWSNENRHSGKRETSASGISLEASAEGDSGQARMTKNVLDQWILSLLHSLIKDVTESLDSYDTVKAIDKLQSFITDFSTWYLRRSRDRVGPTADNKEDKQGFYTTTHEVLTTLTKLLAPIVPFLSESMYRNLTNEESVHLTDWPEYNKALINETLIKDMKDGMEVASIILMRRKTNEIKVRTPLKKLHYKGPKALSLEIVIVVSEEGNIQELVYDGQADNWLSDNQDDFAAENLDLEAGKARDIVRSIQEERKKLGTSMDEMVNVILPEWPADFEKYIKTNALIDTLTKGEIFEVKRIQ